MDVFKSRPAPPRFKSNASLKSQNAAIAEKQQQMPESPRSGSVNPYGYPSPSPSQDGFDSYNSHDLNTSQQFAQTGTMTPSSLLNRLETLLVAKSEEIQLAGRLGESLLHQQAELERKIAQLETEAGLHSNQSGTSPSHRLRHDDRIVDPDEDHQDVGDEVKLKLEALEEEMRKWDKDNEDYYAQVGQGMTKVPSTIGLNEPNNDGSLTSAQASRRAKRDQNATRANDIEFATEIGQSLLGEVRRLQALVTERDDTIAELDRAKVSMRTDLENKDTAMRSVEEAVERYKEENWNLEVNLQEIKNAYAELQTNHSKVDSERQKLTKSLASSRTDFESQRIEIERLNKTMDEMVSRKELDLAEMRKGLAGLQRERSDLQGQLEKMNGEMAKKLAKRSISGQIARSRSGLEQESNEHGLEPTADREEDEEINQDDDVFGLAASRRRKTGDGLHLPNDDELFSDGETPTPEGSPAIQRDRSHLLDNKSIEVSELRTTLAHANKTIATLRHALTREKTKRLGASAADGYRDISDGKDSESDDSPAKRSVARGGRRGRRGAFRGGVRSNLGRERIISDEFVDDENAQEDVSMVDHGAEREGEQDLQDIEELQDPTANGVPQTRFTPSLASLEGIDPAFADNQSLRNTTSLSSLKSIRPSSGMFTSAADLRLSTKIKTFDTGVGTGEELMPFVSQPLVVFKEDRSTQSDSPIFLQYSIASTQTQPLVPEVRIEQQLVYLPAPIEEKEPVPTCETSVQTETMAPLIHYQEKIVYLEAAQVIIPKSEIAVQTDYVQPLIQYQEKIVYLPAVTKAEVPSPKAEMSIQTDPMQPLIQYHERTVYLPAPIEIKESIPTSEIATQTDAPLFRHFLDAGTATDAPVIKQYQDSTMETDAPLVKQYQTTATITEPTVSQDFAIQTDSPLAKTYEDSSMETDLPVVKQYRSASSATEPLSLQDFAVQTVVPILKDTGIDAPIPLPPVQVAMNREESMESIRTAAAGSTPQRRKRKAKEVSAREFRVAQLKDLQKYPGQAAWDHRRDSDSFSTVTKTEEGFFTGNETETDTEFEDARETISAPTPVPSSTPFLEEDFYSVREASSIMERIPSARNSNRNSYFAHSSNEQPVTKRARLVDTAMQTDVPMPEAINLPIASIYTSPRDYESLIPHNAVDALPAITNNSAGYEHAPGPIYLQAAPHITAILRDSTQSRPDSVATVTSTNADTSKTVTDAYQPEARVRPPVISMPPPPTLPPKHVSPRKSASSSHTLSSLSRPPRPSSPPPPDLLQRAHTPISEVMNPFKIEPRNTMSSNSLRLQASRVGEFGDVSNTLHSARSRKSGKLASSANSFVSSVGSTHSRQMSIDSNATSESGLRLDGLPAIRTDMPDPRSSTDPTVIHAITQTMIGEYMYKYTRRVMGGGISENRHKRFFWIHPYTRTIYWSASDPGSAAVSQSNSKGTFIEGVRQVIDPNPYPPGLHQHSIMIQTPNREIKITAPTQERHRLWFDAIIYLLARPTGDSTGDGSPRSVAATSGLDADQSGTIKNTRRKYSTPTVGRSKSNAIYTQHSVSESFLATSTNQSSRRARLSTATYMQKRSETPAAEFMALEAEYGSPRSIRSYTTDAFNTTVGEDESMELVNPNHSILNAGDHLDASFEGLENVRVCCGEHDVGRLSHKHSKKHQHHHHSQHSSDSIPPVPKVPSNSPSLRVIKASNDVSSASVRSSRPRKSIGAIFGNSGRSTPSSRNNTAADS